MMLTRRRFSITGAAVLALNALPRAARAASASLEFDLGFSLYGMKTVPLADAVATCARIGYRNVELCLDPGFHAEPGKFPPETRGALRTQLGQLGLTVSGLMLNLNLADPAAHERNLVAIRTAAELGRDVAPDRPPPIETVSRGRPAEWETLKAGMLERLRRWGEAASAAKSRIVLKAHFNGTVSTPDQLAWLITETNQPSIRAAYDYSHFELRDIPMPQSWAALARHTDFVHVKDTAGNVQKAQMLLPGAGRTDYVALFRLFRSTGYRGPVVVEVSSQLFNQPGYDPTAAAEKSFHALSRAILASK